jgi:guanylate kinase
MTRIFILSAASGSGKSSVIERVLAADPRLIFSISMTTRAPRKPNETYQFVSDPEFLALIAQDGFLEHARVFDKYWYGSPKSFYNKALQEDKDLLLDIDVQGASQLKERYPDALRIFLLPPSRSVLEQWLKGRGEDKPEEIERRLKKAPEEIRHCREYDYVVVNEVNRVEEAAAAFAAILAAERGGPPAGHFRPSAQADRIGEILQTFGME